MAPLSRTTQALVSSISSSAPAAGSRIDSGTKLAAVVGVTRGAHAGDLPASVRRRLIDALLPVVERRDADTELPAELGDAQVRLLLPLELCSPPVDPRLMARSQSCSSHADSPGTASTRSGARRRCPAMILPVSRPMRPGARLPRPARMVWPNGYFHDDNRLSFAKHQPEAVERIMSKRTLSQSCSLIAVTLLVALQVPTSAWACGRVGHRVISRLPEHRLTPRAKAAIAELLEPGESLADASLWADENREDSTKTAPWHYVDVPLDEPRYDRKFSGDVSSKGCVVEKINEFKLTVKDPGRVGRGSTVRPTVSDSLRRGYAPSLCHVGDNGDKGGNRTQVQFFNRGC